MKAILIRSVDMEDGWVSGFAITIPDEIETYPEALQRSEVQKAIYDFDWKKFYDEGEVDVTIGRSSVYVVVKLDEETECEYVYGCDFIEVI